MELGWWGVPIAVLGGAIRVSTPFLFVSLGECLTEKSGRINLGLEGILVMGAMSGYGVSYLSGSPWLGVFVAGLTGLALGLLHGAICSLPRVNDIAVGIGLMLLGTGLAFFLGKPFVQPKAPTLPAIHLGDWASSPQGSRRCVGQCGSSSAGGARAGAELAFRNTRGAGAQDGGRQLGTRARWVIRSTACGCWRRSRVASSRASVDRSCRCTTPVGGARGCRVVRA